MPGYARKIGNEEADQWVKHDQQLAILPLNQVWWSGNGSIRNIKNIITENFHKGKPEQNGECNDTLTADI